MDLLFLVGLKINLWFILLIWRLKLKSLFVRVWFVKSVGVFLGKSGGGVGLVCDFV